MNSPEAQDDAPPRGLNASGPLAGGPTSQKPGSGGPGSWVPPSPEDLARLLPQYQIEALIGRGGMGAVYKGLQPALDRAIAIKLLPAELTADVEFVARFQREARTLAKLQHPGIVTVYDFGQTEAGHLYFVMEFVDGTDLHQIIHSTGLNPAQGLEIIGQVCEALQYAHGRGVMHRDIKPANVLLTQEGKAKLADFGLARPVTEESAALTRSNIVMGTPDYIAPEQMYGMADHRADLYALGVMLYEMLTGQTPRGAWAPPSQRVRVDARLDQVVIRALQQDPAMRYQQASEMKTDVDSVRFTPLPRPVEKPQAPRSPQAVPAAAPQRPVPPKSRSSWVPATLAGLLMVGGIAVWFQQQQRKPTVVATREPTPSASAPVVNPAEGKRPAASASSAPATPPRIVSEQKVTGTSPDLPVRQSLDLLSIIDPARDARVGRNENRWVKTGGVLKFVSTSGNGEVAVPVAIRSSFYQVDLAFRASFAPGNSEARIHTYLPVSREGEHIAVRLHGDGRIKLGTASGNVMLTWSDKPAGEGRVRLRWDARRAGNEVLQVLRDGKVVSEWKGDASSLTGRILEPHRNLGMKSLTGLFSAATPVEFSEFKLSLFEGEAENLVPSMTPPAASASPAVAGMGTSPAPAGANDEVLARLTQIAGQFQAAYDRDIIPVHTAAVADLDSKYLAAVKRALDVVTQRGALDEAVMIREEVQRVTVKGGLPATDSGSLPDSLKKLRATYRASLEKLVQERDVKAGPYFDRYDQLLEAYQKELTQGRRLDDALKVRAKRDEVTRNRAVVPAAPAAGAPAVAADAVPGLFDGRSLNGWHVQGDKAGFDVSEGCIRATGAKANLLYDGKGAAAMKDFELSLKVRMGAGANSGIWIHSNTRPTQAGSVALEVQLDADESHAEKTGSIYHIAPVGRTVVHPNQWFDMKVVVVKKSIEVFINGNKVSEWTQPAGWKPPANISNAYLRSGTFGFQSHTGQVWFKDVLLKEL